MSELADAMEQAFKAVAKVQGTMVGALVRRRLNPAVITDIKNELQAAMDAVQHIERNLPPPKANNETSTS